MTRMTYKFMETDVFQRAAEEIIHLYLPNEDEYNKFIKIIKKYHKGTIAFFVKDIIRYKSQYNRVRRNKKGKLKTKIDAEENALIWHMGSYINNIRGRFEE